VTIGRDRTPVVLVAAALVTLVAAFALVWRGHDVRAVLLVAALLIGALAGHPGVVLRKAVETLADAKFLLPICTAMGFAHVMRHTGCVEALVRILLRPLSGLERALLPAGSGAALVVNMAIPSQTSTLAATGPLVAPLMARGGQGAVSAGVALVFGASIAGALLNPGVAEVLAVSKLTGLAAPRVAVSYAPGVLAAFVVGSAIVAWRARAHRGEAPLRVDDASGAEAPSRLKALLPPLPIVWLLLGHPSLPTHALVARVTPERLEVATAMLVGSALAMTLATRDRKGAMRAQLDGMGYAFAHVVSLIAVSSGFAKSLELAGVLRSFVAVAHGQPAFAFLTAFALAFALAFVSGSGTASSVALVAALGPRAAELGVASTTLCGVILFAAEAGRTASPVAAVLLFGGTLVDVPPRVLTVRLLAPCVAAAAVGALVCVAQG
jgi:C4-dicarboxylate transporter, DcuC family